MDLNKLNLVELNAQELVSTDGGRIKIPSLPPNIKGKLKEAKDCVVEFCSGFWNELIGN